METKQKLHGVISVWKEPAGWGFVVTRKEDGVRFSWFLHASRIQSIEGGGIPQPGQDVLFDEEPNERGPLAVNAEIKSMAPKIQQAAGLKSLAGNGGGK